MYIASKERYTIMEYNRCGDSGLMLPKVSLGLWHNFGDTANFENMRQLCFTAFDNGITQFDLANNYGPEPGSAEINFGRILKEDLGKYRSTAVAAALLDLEVEQVTGKGAGLTDEALKRKCRVIEEAIEKYSLRDADAFTILKTVGGLDIAGLTGVFIGAAIEQIPVVIDGVISAVAALLAETLCKGAVNYMIPSHKSRELAETAIMKKLHLDPVLDADMALGEGTGAVMMMSLLDVALGVYLQGASFANFEIEQYKRYEE